MIRYILCIAMGFICPQTANAQLVQNGNFELSDTSNTTFKSWTNADAGYTVSREEDMINNGKYVLKVQRTLEGSGSDYFRQEKNYQPKGQLEKYTFSCYLKTANITKYGYASVHFRAFDEAGYRLFSLNNQKISVKGSTAWKKVSAEISIPALTKRIEFGGILVGDGTAWFDDFRLDKINTGKIEQSEEARKYLEKALSFITRNSMRKDSVDMKRITANAYSTAADAKSTADCYMAIDCALMSLGDHHSFLQTPEEVSAYASDKDSKVAMPVCRLIHDRIGYITVPTFMSIGIGLQKQFADSMQRLIKEADRKDIIGWVVDIRNNGGGNCFPMLVGIGPVLGEGTFSYSIDAKGKKDSSRYLNGMVISNNDTALKVDGPYTLVKRNPYVAVLTNGSIGSSGEVVVIAFKNRPHTRSFGTPTYGLTSGNEDFQLSDGAKIYLATGWDADRFGNKYTGKVIPDVTVDDNNTTENDEVVDAAVAWLEGHK